AWIRQSNGDPAGALEAMSEAEEVAPGLGVTGLLNPVPAQQARLQLAQGNLAAAARWARERGLGPDDDLGYPREREYLVLARVLRAFAEKEAAPGARRGAAAVPGLADQLTARELDVLRLLAAGAPNPRIAEQLVVSLDTVKKHVSHLLGKLGAANRTEAVTRARQLGLIPNPAPAADPRRHHRAPCRPVCTIVPGAARRRFHRHTHLRVT